MCSCTQFKGLNKCTLFRNFCCCRANDANFPIPTTPFGLFPQASLAALDTAEVESSTGFSLPSSLEVPFSAAAAAAAAAAGAADAAGGGSGSRPPLGPLRLEDDWPILN